MKEKNIKEKTQQKKKMGLTTKIFVALIAGAILGIILCYLVPDSSFKKDVIVEGILYVIGQGFIRLMKMLVVPLVFCSLVCGSMSIGDTKKLGTVGVRTLVFYLATTALAVSVALTVGNLINPGVGLDMSSIQSSASSVETMEATSLTDTILNIIPDNPINSLASGTMLQVIVFALIVGVILAKMGERAETVANFFSQFNDIMMEMTMMIMALAPIGVFCLITPVVAENGSAVLGSLAMVLLAAYICYVIHMAVVYSLSVRTLAKISPIAFFKGMAPAMAMAFSSASSVGTLPLNMECTEKLGAKRDIASFVLPLGATINMDGTAIYQGVCSVFIASCFGIDLTLTQMVTIVLTATLASIGTAGVPGSGMIMLAMVLQSVGLPVEGIALVAGVDRIFDMGRTTVNITGDAACTLAVSRMEERKEQRKLRKQNASAGSSAE